METAITRPFADGEYRFWLGLPQIIDIQRKTGDTSLVTIYDRLSAAIGLDGDDPVFIGGGSPMIADIRETIRCGLIGGNSAVVDKEQIEVGPVLAGQLVESYVAPARPMQEGLFWHGHPARGHSRREA